MGTAQKEGTAQLEWLSHRMNLLAQRAALRLRRLAEGPHDLPETWASLAKRIGLYCVPLQPGQVSGRGYYCSPDMVRSEGWNIPAGWGVIFYDVSVEPIEQCRILVHELAHDTLEGWEATALPDEPLFVWEGDPPRLEDLARLPVLHGYDDGPLGHADDPFSHGATASGTAGSRVHEVGSHAREVGSRVGELANYLGAETRGRELADYRVLRQGVHHLIARRTESLLLPRFPVRKGNPVLTLAMLALAPLGLGCTPKPEAPATGHLSGITTPQAQITTPQAQNTTPTNTSTAPAATVQAPPAPRFAPAPALPVRPPVLPVQPPVEPVPQLPPTVSRAPQDSPIAPRDSFQARESRVGNGCTSPISSGQPNPSNGQPPLSRLDMVPGTNQPRQGVAPNSLGLNPGMPSQYGPIGQGGTVNLGTRRR